MTVTLLDTKTGRTVEVPPDACPRAFEWAENNWSCDCNRAPYFDIDLPPANRCVGAHRFLVVAFEDPDAEGPPHTLRELNADYPEELLREHGVI